MDPLENAVRVDKLTGSSFLVYLQYWTLFSVWIFLRSIRYAETFSERDCLLFYFSQLLSCFTAAQWLTFYCL